MAIRFWKEPVFRPDGSPALNRDEARTPMYREFFELDTGRVHYGSGRPLPELLTGHVDEAIIKQHPEAYAAYKAEEAKALEEVPVEDAPDAPVEEVIVPEE